MHQSKLGELLERYLQRTASDEEEQLLFNALEKEENQEAFQRLIDTYYLENEGDLGVNPDAGAAILEAIYKADEQRQPKKILRFPNRFIAAAAILLLLAGATWLYLGKGTMAPEFAVHKTIFKNDVPPGSPKALLTLADGSTIMLDSVANGQLAQQGNTQIIKLNEGQLTYKDAHGVASGWNTITTPRGGQYQVVLPDGTKAWLNAASSIHFPTAFSESQRRVTITGEVYMEVAANARQPFVVHANEAIIEVLGTSFNINAYNDEAHLKATLLSGSIRVLKGSQSLLLKPGQQAGVAADIKLSNADLEQVVAWKNGYFNFEGMDLPMAMRQIARWYNVEVSFKGKVPDKQFGGELPRNLSLQRLIQLIRFGDVLIEIEGNRITIIGD